MASRPTPSVSWNDLTIAVPVYARPEELNHLLESIAAMTALPAEVLLCEDKSPDRPLLKEISARWAEILALKGCSLNYVENAENLGYDGNLRNLFAKATRSWVLLLGNDDAMLPNALAAVAEFIARHPDVRMISRTFVKFKGDITNIVGITRLAPTDRIFTKKNTDPGLLIRLSGFLGGLVLNRLWAIDLATDRYDGTLYYQFFLATVAFSDKGIGYIAEPLVGSRVGNPPMFGSASAEKTAHAPGAYSPQARAAMWEGIIRICTDTELHTSVPLVVGIRRELSGRQSFHVFELVTVQGRRATLGLVREFRRLGLMNHPLPWTLTAVGLILGRGTHHFYESVRRVQQWSVHWRPKHRSPHSSAS